MSTIVDIPNEGTALADRIADTRTQHVRGDNQYTAGGHSKIENGIPILGGNNSAYRIARLKRDHPELATR